ncbi:MAG: hypothetical protein FH749_04380 [Firmicutes bacterium]|nr:hypothetical protein [Bacillota bacterium]
MNYTRFANAGLRPAAGGEEAEAYTAPLEPVCSGLYRMVDSAWRRLACLSSRQEEMRRTYV